MKIYTQVPCGGIICVRVPEPVGEDTLKVCTPEYNGVFSGGADPVYTVIWDGGERVLVTPPGGGYGCTGDSVVPEAEPVTNGEFFD